MLKLRTNQLVVWFVQVCVRRIPKLLDKLKYESKMKTTEWSGAKACSLARNTLGGVGG